MTFRVIAPPSDGQDRGDFSSWDIPSAVAVAVGGTSAKTATLPQGVYRVISTTDCWIARGASPTAAAATVGNIYMPLDVTEYIYLEMPQQLAVIQDSVAGNLSICPATQA